MGEVNRPFGYGVRQRRWGFFSWWFSLLLIVPLLGIILTLIVQSNVFSQSGVEGVIVDEYTEQPVAEAKIRAGELELSTGNNGKFRLNDDVNHVTVEKEGYEPESLTVTPGTESIEVRLRPNVVQGLVVSLGNDEPVAGATVDAVVDDEPVRSATTDDAGQFLLVDVPEGAQLVVDSPDYAMETVDLTRKTWVDVSLRPDVVIGRVVDDSGEVVPGATVAIGESRVTLEEDGTFRLEGAPESGDVIVKAPGYEAWVQPLNETMRVDAELVPIYIRSIYATADTAATPEKYGELLNLIERTNLNAIVVDLKSSDGIVFYDTRVELAHEIGAVRDMLDPRAITDDLRERGIYSIARIVVFEDPTLARARPEWAIRDNTTGDMWRTWNGLGWVNAHRSEVWEYNTALALEAAEMGFDEIQLDYIRFPTDGPLNRADYGVEHNEETRPASIHSFLSGVHEALAPTRAYLGADIFGLTLWELGDGGIGQHLETVIDAVDYIHPMIYPSHFGPGSMGFDQPNDHPYEVILWSLENGLERMPGREKQMRPWLQDFSYGPGISYGDEEVREQIRATEETESSGWLLWNAANVFREGALSPQ